MSAKLMGEVWELNLPQKHAWILMSLCDHAEHDGTGVYPGNGYTAWKTGYSESTIKRTLRELKEDYKLIELIEDGGGKRASEWRICIENFEDHRKESMPGRGAPRENKNAAKEKQTPVRATNRVQCEPGSGENKPGSLSRTRDDRNRPIEPSGFAKAGESGSPPPEDDFQGWHIEEYLRDELSTKDVALTRARGRRYTGEANKLRKEGVDSLELYEAADRVIERWEAVELTLDKALRDVRNGKQTNGKQPPQSGGKYRGGKQEPGAAKTRKDYDWFFRKDTA